MSEPLISITEAAKNVRIFDNAFVLDALHQPSLPRDEREANILVDSGAVVMSSDSSFKAINNIVVKDGLAVMTLETFMELLASGLRAAHALEKIQRQLPPVIHV